MLGKILELTRVSV